MLAGAVAAVFAGVFLGAWGAFIFWITTILVDVDHYLQFLRYGGGKHLSIKKFLAFHVYLFQDVRNNDKFLTVHLFHTAEFVALAAVAAFMLAHPYGWAALAGIIVHILTDFRHLARHGVYGRRANSYLEYFRRYNRLKKAGLDPDLPFKAAIKHLESL